MFLYISVNHPPYPSILLCCEQFLQRLKECVTPAHIGGQPIRVSITAESTDLYWSTQCPWDNKHSPAPTLQWSSLFLGRCTMALAPQIVVALLSVRHSAGNDPLQSWMSHLHTEKHRTFIWSCLVLTESERMWMCVCVRMCVCACAVKRERQPMQMKGKMNQRLWKLCLQKEEKQEA